MQENSEEEDENILEGITAAEARGRLPLLFLFVRSIMWHKLGDIMPARWDPRFFVTVTDTFDLEEKSAEEKRPKKSGPENFKRRNTGTTKPQNIRKNIVPNFIYVNVIIFKFFWISD